MNKIFQEIKKAIEEEMRNAEGRPPPGQQREGGRRAREYAEWLDEEQKRLRGETQTESQDGREAEPGGMTEQEWEERKVRRPDPERHLEAPRRESREASQRQSRESTPRRPASSTQYERSEARHQRETDDAYRYAHGRGSYLKGQVHGLLRSPQGLRQAFILREIVSKPVSLRDKDDHLLT